MMPNIIDAATANTMSGPRSVNKREKGFRFDIYLTAQIKPLRQNNSRFRPEGGKNACDKQPQTGFRQGFQEAMSVIVPGDSVRTVSALGRS